MFIAADLAVASAEPLATRGPTPGALGRPTQSTLARWLYLVHRGLQRLSGGRAALHVYLFYAQPTEQPALEKLRDDPEIVVVPIEAGSPMTTRFPRSAEVIAQRFAKGACCFAVLVRNRFAGYLWLARYAHEEDEVRCRYQLPRTPSSVWDFDVFIAPEFRSGRTMARLWKASSARLLGEGVLWTFSRISLFNAASIQSHERLGALQVAKGTFVVAGALQLAVFSTAPYVHFSWRRSDRPVLNLAVPAARK